MWKSVDAFAKEATTATDERLKIMCSWAGERESSSDEPGMGRNPKARRAFRQMRQVAKEELERRGLLDSEDSVSIDNDHLSTEDRPATRTARAVKSRIMYIESKADGLTGPARIGRVTFSKTGQSIYYGDRTFQSLKGGGFKANYYDLESGDHYWISGPRKDGRDRLYGEAVPVEIDDDVREEYWRDIRGLPQRSTAHIANR